jgi:hypothetical protein
LPKQESDERKLLTYSQEEAPKEPEKPMEEEKEEPGEPELEPNPEPEFETEQQLQPLQTTGDLLVLFCISFFSGTFLLISSESFYCTFILLCLMQNLDEEVNPLVTDLEEHNALALAIVAPGTEYDQQIPLLSSALKWHSTSQAWLLEH